MTVLLYILFSNAMNGYITFFDSLCVYGVFLWKCGRCEKVSKEMVSLKLSLIQSLVQICQPTYQ